MSDREAIAQAVREHYQPTQAGAPIPTTIEGRIVALADKLDTLTGLFAIGQPPTASKDPYGLRRAALGVLRILIEGGLSLDLRALLRQALDAQPVGTRDAVTLEALWAFTLNRFVGLCSDKLLELQKQDAAQQLADVGGGMVVNWPITEIVASVSQKSGDPQDLMRRAVAVFRFLRRPEAASLAAADKRARNILKQADRIAGAIDAARFEHAAERGLAHAIESVEADLVPLRAAADYDQMLGRLAQLKAPVDAFFQEVMVMADDETVRLNRLGLLAKLDAMCREVADLSQLPG